MNVNREDQVVVICLEVGKNTPFTDNVEARCAACGVGVVHRPHVPEPSTKLCYKCGVEIMNEEEALGRPVEPALYEGQREEVEKHLGPGAAERIIAQLEKARKATL